MIASALTFGLSIVGIVLVIVAALVLIYLFAISKLRQGTAVLQEQANDAQGQIIDAMQHQIDELRHELDAFKELTTRQAAELTILREQVTSAAKVDELRDEMHQGHEAILMAINGGQKALTA